MTIELDGTLYEVSGAPENMSRGVLRQCHCDQVASLRQSGFIVYGPVFTARDASGAVLWHAAETNGDPIFSGTEEWDSLDVCFW